MPATAASPCQRAVPTHPVVMSDRSAPITTHPGRQASTHAGLAQGATRHPGCEMAHLTIQMYVCREPCCNYHYLLRSVQFMTAFPTELESRCATIERRCSAEVGRNIERLHEHASGGLYRALRSIVTCDAPSIAILTGYFIPDGHPPAAETDGPLGAAILSAALTEIGLPVQVITDHRCIDAVAEVVEFIGGPLIEVGVFPDLGGSFTDVLWRRERRTLAAQSVSHVISIECLGPGIDGRIRNMRGEDCTSTAGALYRLFSGLGLHRVGIGDGGNELGMGNIPPEIVAADIEHGDRIQCRVKCDDLIVSGCANWGAFGMVAGLGIAFPDHQRRILQYLQPSLHHEALKMLVERKLAVDGVDGSLTLSVDGLDEAAHQSVLSDLSALEPQRIGVRSGIQRFRQSMSLAVKIKVTARAS
jgi:hypothetical protein